MQRYKFFGICKLFSYINAAAGVADSGMSLAGTPDAADAEGGRGNLPPRWHRPRLRRVLPPTPSKGGGGLGNGKPKRGGGGPIACAVSPLFPR